MDMGNRSRAENRGRLAYEGFPRDAQAEKEETGQGSGPFSRQAVARTRPQTRSRFVGPSPPFHIFTRQGPLVRSQYRPPMINDLRKSHSARTEKKRKILTRLGVEVTNGTALQRV